VWGGLQKEAIQMVNCKTVDLYVPEHTEIILEGRMDPIGWVEPEGMYGEFPGTYSGMRKNPIVTIQAVTSRKKAIYQSATHGGRHLAYTDFFVLIPQIELSIREALRNAGIDVKQVRIVAESAGMMCYASINVRAKGDSRNTIYVILSASRQNFPKYCIVVDADIDVFDDEAIMWALSTRSQPTEDTVILEGMRIPSSSDPSLVGPAPYSMSKMGIDATIPVNADKSRYKHSKPPQVCGKKSSNRSKMNHLAENIRKLLEEKGPLFFYEISNEFPKENLRNILLGWSELRDHGVIEENMEGKYSIHQK
jgi:2,5-furandicarboxylate decarboxylase 1